MQRSTARILTTHAGSLVRPKPILEAMKAFDLQQSPGPNYDATLAAAVAEVIDHQLRVGIDVPSDGEFGRPGFSRYIWQRVEGLELREPNASDGVRGVQADAKNFPEFYRQYTQHTKKLWMHPEVSIDEVPNIPGDGERYRATGPIKYRGQAIIQKEIANLKAALEGQTASEAFIPALGRVGHNRGVQEADYKDYYPDEESYRFALADAFHEEYKAITDAGFLLQVDYPNMQRAFWDQLAHEREEIDRSVNQSIDALNYALRDIPEEMVRFHYCWGSPNVPHTSDPPLRQVVDLILKVKAQAYSIEAANPRHEHEWMVWKDVKLPEGKILIPGVISHQTNVVEHPELVAWRIENFASVVGKENVIAGTDCGFSQNWDNIRVHPEVQWAKLQSLAEGAAIASKKLWS